MSLYLGTSPIANTGYDKANTDLSNLTNTGKNIANWSSNVSNCITEIPQDIKLELNNGTLTLKAGSKVYVPNGVGVFNEVTITSDMQITPTGYTSLPHMLCVLPNNTIQLLSLDNQQYSGSTPPSGQRYMFWYDTANNYVKYTTDSGSTWQSGWCLPLAIVTITNGTGVTSIDQVFNGFGYIGSTVFALPGVKGLIPNGRNTDGTLKNTEFTIPQVQTFTHTRGTIDRIHYFCYPTGGNITIHNYFLTGDKPTSGNRVWFDTVNNVVYFCEDWASASSVKYKLQTLMFGWSKLNNSVISDLETKTAFHALDYNDSSTISGWAMPDYNNPTSISGNSFTAPSDGFACIQTAASSVSIPVYVNGNIVGITSNKTVDSTVQLLVGKGDVITCSNMKAAGSNFFPLKGA